MPRTDGAVCLYQGAPLFCHSDLSTPALIFTGAFERRTLPLTGVLFQSMAAWGESVLVVGQGHLVPGAFGVIVRPGQPDIYLHPLVLGMAVNANPVAVQATGGGFKVAIVRSAISVEILFITPGGDVSSLGFRTIPHTSQGITGWDGDTLLLGDPVQRLIAGRSLHEATKVGPWWIGQDSYANRIVLVNEQTGFAWTAYETRVGQRPRFVRLPDGRFAVTASDDYPVALVLDLPATSDDTIGREPTPDPLPPPEEEEPHPMPEIPNYVDHVKRVWATHGGATDEAAAKVTRITAYEIHHGLNGAPKDPRVGLYRKRSASTIQDRDPDKLCFNLGGGSLAFVDIVAAAGSPDARPGWGEPHFEHDEDPHDFTSWVAPEPEPGVHTGGDGDDPGDEDQPLPAPTVHESLKQVSVLIADAGLSIRSAQLALAAVQIPEQPPPHECPPCPLQHGGGVELQPYEEALALGREIQAAVSDLRRLGGEAFAHLLHRYYARSHTREQIVEEARRRAQGTWQEDW